MNSEENKIFKAKIGYCHVFNDKIILSKDLNIDDISKVVVSNNINRVLIIYGLISVFLLYKSYAVFINKDYVFSLLFLSLGLYLFYGIITSRNTSTTPIILEIQLKKLFLLKQNLF